MCSESMESITRPLWARYSSPSALSAFHTRVVASNMGVRRLDLLSSGPKTRKFLASSFSRITSRIKVPSTSMSWASTAPGAGRSMP